MPEANCHQDRRWSFSSPNRSQVLTAIVNKHKSLIDEDGHYYKNFTIKEDNGSKSDVIAQYGQIAIDTGASTYKRPLRGSNEGSE